MRDYEIVYIFRPEMESEDVEDRLESFHEQLDGEVTAVEHWGQRELAYEIQDERRGYYAVAQFRAEPPSLEGFERALDLDGDLIRHLLVLSEGEVPTPPSGRREEEDEEDGAEEDEGEDADDGDGDGDAGDGDEDEETEDGNEEEEDGASEGADEEGADEEDADEEDRDEADEAREDGEAADETDDEDEER